MPVAVITGGDSGIGRASAVMLAERGWDVGITYRSDADGAGEAAVEIEALGRRCDARRLDLTETDTIAPTVLALADALGGLECLVNNAGTGASAPFLEHGLDEWRTVIETDLTGAFVAGQAAARRMVEQGDRGHPRSIINITSVHEHVPLAGSAAYCAAKGGLGLLTKVMAYELAEHGITVNSVAPGQIATPMTGAHDEDPEPGSRRWIPAGRPGHAREIGEWVAFLASGARYATGGSYVVDGGLELMAAIPNQHD
jgi:NAD(P)-dependent dehydrogenase (short-subunit alcohol dehydrogenase family)